MRLNIVHIEPETLHFKPEAVNLRHETNLTCKQLTGQLQKVLANLIVSTLPIPNQVRKRLVEVIKKNFNAFAASPIDLGNTSVVNHTIKIGKAKPFRDKLRPTPLARRQYLKHKMEKLLALEAISEADLFLSNSSFSSTLVYSFSNLNSFFEPLSIITDLANAPQRGHANTGTMPIIQESLRLREQQIRREQRARLVNLNEKVYWVKDEEGVQQHMVLLKSNKTLFQLDTTLGDWLTLDETMPTKIQTSPMWP